MAEKGWDTHTHTHTSRNETYPSLYKEETKTHPETHTKEEKHTKTHTDKSRSKAAKTKRAPPLQRNILKCLQEERKQSGWSWMPVVLGVGKGKTGEGVTCLEGEMERYRDRDTEMRKGKKKA